jgi:hypothetical protein
VVDDAHAEARRRIAEVVLAHQRREAGACDCGFADWGCPHSLHVADAVLDGLFPDVTWDTTWTNGHLTMRADPDRATHRQLTLAGPVEPVTEEREP